MVIVNFMDAHNFCIGRVKRSCIHCVTPEEKVVPCETCDRFYRDAAARERLRRSLEGR